MRSVAFLVLFLLLPHLKADWPVFRGDAAMTGTRDEKLPETLEELWTFDCGAAVNGAPAISEGVAYIASKDAHLYALELATGKEKWRKKLGRMEGSPGVHGELVVVGDLDNTIHALDRKSGEKRWSFATNQPVHSSPVFAGDSVLIGSDRYLHRLDLHGKKIWEFDSSAPIYGTPTIVGEQVLFAGCDGKFHILELATGKEKSAVEFRSQTGSTVAVSGTTAIFGTMNNVILAMDIKANKPLWSFEGKNVGAIFSSAAIAGDLAILGCRSSRIHALNLTTGKEVWSFVAEGNVDASPVVVREKVYVGSLSDTGDFYVLDLKTGKLIQQLNLTGRVTGSAAIADEKLLVATDKGIVHCLGAKAVK